MPELLILNLALPSVQILNGALDAHSFDCKWYVSLRIDMVWLPDKVVVQLKPPPEFTVTVVLAFADPLAPLQVML